jgi:biotin carboxyl carrier protein
VYRYVDGIGGRTLSAPQARLMSLVISGILNQKLPWTLVLLGIFIGIVVELCGVHALPFAVGVYLPLSTTTPVFFGGLMKLISDRLARRTRRAAPADEEASEGMLFSSGLIAGGALMGIGVAALILGSGRLMPLANSLEALRADGLHLAMPTDALVTVDGQPVTGNATLPARSRWFERELVQPDGTTVKKRELVPALEVGGRWRPFEAIQLEVTTAKGERQSEVIEYDPEARARTVRFSPVEVWRVPVVAASLGRGVGTGTLARWLADEGAEVAFGQPLARVETPAGPVEVKAPQAGRLQVRQIAAGAPVEVGAAIGTLELTNPPIGVGRPPLPASARRILVEPRPASDDAAMLIFLILCAVLVWSSFPRRGAAA